MFLAALIRVTARNDGFKHYLWSWQTKVQGNENITGLCRENCIFAQPFTAGINPSEVTLGSTKLKGNCNLDPGMQIWQRNVSNTRTRQKTSYCKSIISYMDVLKKERWGRYQSRCNFGTIIPQSTLVNTRVQSICVVFYMNSASLLGLY